MEKYSYGIAPDPNGGVVTICGDPPCLHMSEDVPGGKLHTYRNPYNLSSPPMPGNYLDFMNLVYVALENKTVNNIPYLTKKINFCNVSDLASKAIGEYNLARRGLKYFAFYSVAKEENKTDIFVDKSNMVKAFVDSGNDIERIFITFNQKMDSENFTLSELLDKNFNNSLSNLTISSIKMEEILKMNAYNSGLSVSNNSNCCCNHNNNNNSSNELFGHQHNLYQYLVQILKQTNEILANPKVPEGMVTREELALSLSKIIPGVSEEELTKILKNYTTPSDVELKLVNYVLKTDLENRLSNYIAKADAIKYVTKDEVKAELVENLAKYYDRQIIDVMMKNLSTKDEIDLKLQNYLLKADYKSALDDYATKEYVKNQINNAALGGGNTNTPAVDLSIYETKEESKTQIAAAKAEILATAATKVELAAKLDKTEADALYAKKGEVSTGGTETNVDLSEYAKKAEVEATYATKEYVTTQINNAQLGGGDTEVDLSAYATKTEVEAKLDKSEAEATYAKKEEIPAEVDLSNYATKEEVTNQINQAQLGGGDSEVDLSIYATKDEITAKLDKTEAETLYMKKDEVPEVDLSAYATKEENELKLSKEEAETIYIKKTEAPTNETIQNKINIADADAKYATKIELESKYVLKTEAPTTTVVNAKLDKTEAETLYSTKEEAALKLDKTEAETTYAKKADVPTNDAVAAKLDITTAEATYATKTELVAKLDKTEADTNYATQNWVTSQINQAQLGGDQAEVDLTVYALKTSVASDISTAVDGAKAELTTTIDTKVSEAKTATLGEVDTKITAAKGDLTTVIDTKLDKTEAGSTYLAKTVLEDTISGASDKIPTSSAIEAKLSEVRPVASILKENQHYMAGEFGINQSGDCVFFKTAVDSYSFATDTSSVALIDTTAIYRYPFIIPWERKPGLLYANAVVVKDGCYYKAVNKIAGAQDADLENPDKFTVLHKPLTGDLSTLVNVTDTSSLIAVIQELTNRIKTLEEKLNKEDQVETPEPAPEGGDKGEETPDQGTEDKGPEAVEKTQEATTLTVNPETLSLKVGVEENNTLTFETNADGVVVENPADNTDTVEISVADKVATIKPLKEGQVQLTAKATATATDTIEYTEATLTIDVTVAAADAVDESGPAGPAENPDEQA